MPRYIAKLLLLAAGALAVAPAARADDLLHVGKSANAWTFIPVNVGVEEGLFAKFDPAAVAVLKKSFVDMGLLPEAPRDDQILTTRFVPVIP
ncbi:MAG TPA: hypothetical protein VHX19_23020 [Stellaceae bacterium]|jgi:ABC-type nitrate/sulfonate/bicarbonate transport system substrate-binding protein|nr:hypothetical protein [Stellaceae bacterium]